MSSSDLHKHNGKLVIEKITYKTAGTWRAIRLNYSSKKLKNIKKIKANSVKSGNKPPQVFVN